MRYVGQRESLFVQKLKTAIKLAAAKAGLNLNRKFDSRSYWIERYKSGGTSGAGSYGRLAQYKGDLINALVRELDVKSVVEFGCGDGSQASFFDFPSYTGLDVSRQVVEDCRDRFHDRSGWEFKVIEDTLLQDQEYEMSMSLDVIYHLTEDHVFERYMTDLFRVASRFVLIYSSDDEKPYLGGHENHRRYSEWVKRNCPTFTHMRTWPQPYPVVEGDDGSDTSLAFFRLYARS
jgi:hypothetical protein